MMKKSGQIASCRLWVCSKNIFRDNIIFYLFCYANRWNNEWKETNPEPKRQGKKKDWNSKTKNEFMRCYCFKDADAVTLCVCVCVYCPDCISGPWIIEYENFMFERTAGFLSVSLYEWRVFVWTIRHCISTHMLKVTIPAAAFQLSCVVCLFGAWLLKHFSGRGALCS